ncbi:amidohydrolase family protein [Pseudonocardia yuanmonensis]|uniref:Amidohydrolase family protein n=1 Tax=Pseudonocardia yuanmonensis TaxID=1095914 RepID=A0ABP8X8M3_9PSEU
MTTEELLEGTAGAGATSWIMRDATVDGRRADLTISSGRIVAITPPAPGPGIPLGGRTVLPGLWDNHVHFDQWALARRRLDLSGARSAAEAAALVADRVRARPGPVTGFGFRDGLWPDRPDRALLDVVSAGHEVVLVSADLHCCWLNSAAARRFGHADHPTGLISEADWHPIMEAVRQVPAAELDAAVDEAARAAAARGVVGIVDFEAPFPLDAWTRRIRTGTAALRVVAAVWPTRLAEAVSRGLRTGAPIAGTGGLLTMGPLKVVTDGSLNTRTAYCVDPYPLDRAGPAEHPCGMLLVPPEDLVPLLRTARAAGIDAAVHAIGDAANTIVLDAFAATGIRGRIEHAQLLSPDDLTRFAALGVVASVQPEHAVDDRDVADRHWAGRTHRSFAYRSLLDAGAELVLGSDAPVAPLDPWSGIAAAVHRSSDTRAPWHPEQHLPLTVALAATFGPDGPLRPGRVADLVVLDADPATVTPAELRRMPIAATMLAGRWTYAAGLP